MPFTPWIGYLSCVDKNSSGDILGTLLHIALMRLPGLRLGKLDYGEDTHEYHAFEDVRKVPGPDEPRRRSGSG
jgi:hypothetical protein